MNEAYLYNVPAPLIALIMFLLMLIFNLLGYRYRQHQTKKDPTLSNEGLGQVESSLMGLTALMLAFTFGLAHSKFEKRRDLIVEEANNIGTALLRCDLYPDSVRQLLRQDFKEYIDDRIAYYKAGADEQKIQTALKRGEVHSYSIWKRSADYARISGTMVPTGQMVPAVNAVIDIVTTRDALRVAKVPPFILFVLSILLLISSFLAGFGQKGKRNIILVTGFVLMTTITLYLILELDRPRRGILNLDNVEQRIVDLKAMVP